MLTFNSKITRMLIMALFIIVILTESALSQSYPTILKVEPNFVTVGSSGIDLYVYGEGFDESCYIIFNGTDKTTTFVSEYELKTSLTADDLSHFGIVGVSVRNSEDVESEMLSFTIACPTPTIEGISPSHVLKGSGSFSLVVSGSDFMSHSVVLFNGSARTTRYESDTQLVAIIEDGDVAAAGASNISVYTPGPGGGESEAFAFVVEYPTPNLNAITPNEVIAGSAGFTLTLYGSNFQTNSVAMVDGSARTTTYVNSGELQALIETNDLVYSGNKEIQVYTPGPGGGMSEPVILSVVTPTIPEPIALTPSVKVVGSAGFTMYITGVNFMQDSKVYFNDAERQTQYINSETLSVYVPQSDLSAPATYNVTVVNSQNEKSTNQLQFQVIKKKLIVEEPIDLGPKERDEIASVASEYLLSNNYPNPFNPATTISFGLPADATVSLKVYNMLGQEVASLVNNEAMSAGYYQKNFDASNLASGQYIYRLVATSPEAGEFSSTGRMLLMK